MNGNMKGVQKLKQRIVWKIFLKKMKRETNASFKTNAQQAQFNIYQAAQLR